MVGAGHPDGPGHRHRGGPGDQHMIQAHTGSARPAAGQVNPGQVGFWLESAQSAKPAARSSRNAR